MKYTKEENKNAQYLIDWGVKINQSPLVNELLNKQFFNNAYTHNAGEDGNGDEKEVMEWWAISWDFVDRLINHGQIVLETDFGYWWGRQTSGQAIIQDGTFQKMIRASESE